MGGVSFSLDSYILDQDRTYWRADLSDGTSVFQDDGRPGNSIQSAWERLRIYTKEKSLSLVSMSLIFRDHVESVPTGQDGYYFSKGVRATPGWSKEHYTLGYKSPLDEVWTIIWFAIPEILETFRETRTEVDPKFVIINRT
jgi:hypothetical protein